MKRTYFPFLTLAFTFLFAPFAVQANFTDVPEGSQYHEAVSTLENLKIVEGYEDGSFGVDLPVNRAEFLKMAYLAEAKHHPDRRTRYDSSIFGSEESEEEVVTRELFPFGEEDTITIDPPCFPDLDGKKWFDSYVCWGKQQGLVAGYPDGKFRAEQGVNFAEAAKMLVETADQTHTNRIDHWAQGYIRALGERTVPGSINAVDEQLTRGQVAELIYYYTLIPDDFPVEDKTFTIFQWDGERFLNLKRLVSDSKDHLSSYYAKGEGGVYYSGSSTSWLEPVGKVEGADAQTFQTIFVDLSPHRPARIALDKNHVYSEGKIVEGSAGGSFSLFDDTLFMEKGMLNFYFYAQDNEHIYLLSCYNGGKVSPCYFKGILKDSDPGSFTILESLYSKDDQNVYFADQKLAEADVNSFEVVLGFLAKDSRHVYFNGERLEGVDSSALQVSPTLHPFQYTGETPEGRSFNFAYSSNLLFDIDGEPIDGSAGGEFKLLSDSFLFSADTASPHNYAVDSTYVYYIDCYYDCKIKLIPDSKVESFEVLGGRWTKDEANVYFMEKIVSEADPATLEPLGNRYFRDADQLFFEGKVIEGVNPDQFEPIFPNEEDLPCTASYGKGGSTVFLGDLPLEIDVQSLEFLDPLGFFYTDDNNVYRATINSKAAACDPNDVEIIPEANVEGFTPLNTNYFISQSSVYYINSYGETILISKADTSSFEPINPLLNQLNSDYSHYAKDANYAYHKDQIIPLDIDLETFEYSYDLDKLTDKNGEYHSREIQTAIGQCSYDYAPVCGEVEGGQQSFRNSCLAKMEGVKNIEEGLCTQQETTWEQACLSNEYTIWYPEWNYCTEIDELTCTEIGGKDFDECGSACDPYDDDPEQNCPDACVTECYFE